MGIAVATKTAYLVNSLTMVWPASSASTVKCANKQPHHETSHEAPESARGELRDGLLSSAILVT